MVYAALALTWIKVVQPPTAAQGAQALSVQDWLIAGFVVLCAVPVAGLVVALVRRRPALWGAQVLDRHHALTGRVANAIAFGHAEKRTPLMDAAIDDAVANCEKLSPRRAAPIRLPRGLWVSVLLGVGVYGLSLLEVRTMRFVPTPVSTFVPLELPTDDVDLLREVADELQTDSQDPELLAAVRRFNQLIEDVAERRLDRQEVFRRLEELEQSLMEQSALDAEALDEGLEGLGKELEKSGLSKPAAQALKQKKLDDAEEALRELAKRLKKGSPKVNKRELERLRKALAEASKQSADRLERVAEQRRRVEEGRRRLLNKKKKGEKLSKKENQELERSQRQLKRLDRQKKRSEKARQQMSKLDQELAEAARKLMDEMGSAADSLERGAEDLNRMKKQQLSDAEKKALKKQLEELRQMLRQNAGNSEKRKEMLERFRQMARGQKGTKPGQGQGQGQGQGKGQKGKGKGQVSLRPGGGGGSAVEIPIPGAGASAGTGQSESEGTGEGGEGVGKGSDSNVKGAETNPQGKAQDVAAAGIDSGEGMASSEVVYGAAERGFTGSGYKKVYTDYRTVAEEVIQTDEIPPGYKFYVRRYFQLIRPRN
jgi:hypothetical protein